MEVEENENEQVASLSRKQGFLTRGRLVLIGAVFLIELGIFIAAATIPIDENAQRSLGEAAKGVSNAAKLPPLIALKNIFANNLRVALFDMIPIFGPVVFVVSIISTGEVVQVIALSHGEPGPLLALGLVTFPYTLVELSAYALAVVSGSMLVVAWRRKTLRMEAPVFLMEVAAVIVILLVAAAMEAVTLVSLEAGLALWLPTGVTIAWLISRLRGRMS